MNGQIGMGELRGLLPLVVTAGTAVVLMLGIAVRRSHPATALLALAGLLVAAFSLAYTPFVQATALIAVDTFALYYLGLLFLAAIVVVLLSYSYLSILTGHREEYYVLLVLAVLGAGVLACSTHFATFFLGIEILSVSLYALTGYERNRDRSIEAGVKYLILAAVSSGFVLFGMALLYSDAGGMDFARLAERLQADVPGFIRETGLVLLIVGLGFKLAVVPFHLWTPDVYEGAPAPVTAFIATVSKGAVFALALRLFGTIGLVHDRALFTVFTVIAFASMFTGNLLALMQQNVKRLLAYSSISHMGYLLITLLTGGSAGRNAAALYLAAYFVTTLGAFGVVTVLSTKDRDADSLEDYRALAWRRPWLAFVFTMMMLSLAGIPLTAGFIGKFYLVAAGVLSAQWTLVVVLVVNSAISLFYYLRIVAVMYSGQRQEGGQARLPLAGSITLGGLSIMLVGIGVYPGPVLTAITRLMQTLP